MFRKAMVLAVAASVVLLAGGVIACGGDSDDDAESADPTAANAEPTTESAEPTATTAQPTATTAAEPTATTAQPTATTEAGSPDDGGSGGTTSVAIVDFGYSPEEITAQAGEELTLELTNSGGAPHTFTIDGVTDSGTIAAGASGSVTFTPSSAGSLQFYCTIHGSGTMSGTLTVE